MASPARSCPLCGRALGEGEYCRCSLANLEAPLDDRPAMAVDGSVEGRFQVVQAPTRHRFGPAPVELELDQKAAQHAFAPQSEAAEEAAGELQQGMAALRRKRSLRRLAFGLVVALAAGATGYLALRDRRPLAERMQELSAITRAPGKPLLLVESEPPGAEVLLGESVLGTTPYAGDFDPPQGNYLLRLRLAGYKPYSTQLAAGSSRSLKVRLERAK